ncbi:hypothetical protein D621_11655 [beta proteobacterium AAP51]|nr:hypothetical protein D621_11655 [beta proteobacterium AAP51]
MAGAALAALGLVVACGSASAQSGNRCGNLVIPGHYGPFDYRTSRQALEIVERHHFTPIVEALIGGSTGDLAADMNYMLKSSPNHHRALVSLSRLADKTAAPQMRNFEWPFDCYFERAVRFRPDDQVVRMIYAQYLGKRKRVSEAVVHLNAAIAIEPENPFTQYNAGLIFLEIGEHARALEQAHKAKKLGFPRTELQDSLKKSGHWTDPAQ